MPSSLTSNSSLGDVKSADFALYIGDYRWDVFGVDVFTYQVSVIQSRHLIAVDLREVSQIGSQLCPCIPMEVNSRPRCTLNLQYLR